MSLRADPRVLATFTVLVAAGCALLVIGVGQGDFPLAPGEVLSALVGSGDRATSFVVLELRLPRALTGLLVGAALGMSGAIFQELSGNALISPDVIGVTIGAALAAVALIVFGDTTSAVGLPIAALAGAAGAGLTLYALAWRGGLHGYRLVLVGIGLSTLLQAGIAYVLTRGRIFEVTEAYIWLVGSLNGRGWEHVWPLTVAIGAAVPALLVLSRRLAALQLGPEMAGVLGVAVGRTQLALLAVAVLLAGVAVAAAGAIAFAAFAAPHIARRVADTIAPGAVLVLSAATGAVLVAGADLAGRLLFGSQEVPVGIVTALLAAPYFLYLLRRAGRVGAS